MSVDLLQEEALREKAEEEAAAEKPDAKEDDEVLLDFRAEFYSSRYKIVILYLTEKYVCAVNMTQSFQEV